MAEEKSISREGPRSFAVLLAGMRDENEESVNDEASAKLQSLVAKLREASLAKDAKVAGEHRAAEPTSSRCASRRRSRASAAPGH